MDIETVDPLSVPRDAILIDIREQHEWDAGHAPNARHIPASTLAEHMGEFVDDEDRDVYIVCRSSGRSTQVAQFLAMNGIEVINVGGGMDAWMLQGLPVVTDDGALGTII